MKADEPSDSNAREKSHPEALPATRRRWRLQFSLRAILLAMLVISIPIFAVVRPYVVQQNAAQRIERLGGTVTTAPGGPEWLRSRFGSGIMRDVVHIDVADCDDPARYMSDVLRCPRLEVLVIGGEHFTDRELLQLAQLTELRGLVLDSTSHTSDGLDQLKASLPSLETRNSWRRAEVALEGVASFKTGTPPKMTPQLAMASFSLQPMFSEYGGPDWLRARTDDKYFKDLIFVYLNEHATDDHLEWLPRLGSYQALHVRGSRVTDQGLAKLSNWGSGQLELHYSGHECSFTDEGLRAMNAAPTCRWNLMLYNLPLADSDLSFISNQEKLEFLVLNECGISDDQLPALVKLPVRELILTGNPITDTGLEHLAAITGLRTLGVRETRVTAEGVERLEQALPKCRVRWTAPEDD